jgi:hypothetical protein
LDLSEATLVVKFARMKRLSRFVPAAVAAVLLVACSHIPFISKKNDDNSKPKDDSHLATGVEAEFKQRWVDKRVNELVGQGMSPDSARAQAESEFRTKYSVTNVAHQ